MAKDVLITPASGSIEFSDTTLKAKIFESDGNLNITSTSDYIVLGGGTASNLQIGDVSTPVALEFLGGGTIDANGGSLYIGTVGDVVNLNVSGVTYNFPSTLLTTADYTAADVLNKIKTVDGAGSGLDADLLDGQHGTYYAPTTQTMYFGTTPLAINRASGILAVAGISSIGFSAHSDDSASITTTVTGTTTYFDFILADDNDSDQWRWIFTPSGASAYNAMTLISDTNTAANLTVSGTITAIGTGANSTNWTDAYNKRVATFTTNGNSGAATFTSNTLNIPNYTLAGLGGQPQLNGTGFVKASGTTISYDNSTYITSSGSITGSAASVAIHSSNEINIGGNLGSGTLYVNYNDGGSFSNYSFYGGNTTLATVTAASFNYISGLGSANPLMNGVTAVGTSTLVSRQDHIHPTDTSRAKTDGTNATGSWPISVTGNAGSVTNGVYTSGSYSDPTWLTISKSKVGLGNVENTALSTWAGSSNITTVGTLAGGTVPWARLSGIPSSFTPSSHTHGNIQNNGTIISSKAVASGDKILITDNVNEDVVTTGPSFGTSTSTYLRNDGAWATPTNTTYTGGTGISTTGTTFYLNTGYGDTVNPYASKTAKYFLAAPNGSAGSPSFRAIVASDIPTLNQSTTGQAGSVANTLTRGSYLTGNNYNGSASTTWEVDATSANTASKVVARDANGDFSARNITLDYLNAASINKVLQYVGEIRTNLGDPTVEENALFHGEMTNKLRFIAPTLQEESTNGTTWTTSSRATANQLSDLMIGEGQSTIIGIIPSGSTGSYGGYRLTWDVYGQTGYIILNHLYMYTATFGHTVNVALEVYQNSSASWLSYGNGSFNNWPGHVSYKHSAVPYTTNASPGFYSKVRLIFSTTRANNTNGVELYSLEWFGGYPAGRKNVEIYDRDKNVTFPSNIIATSNFVTSSGKLCIGTTDTSAKVNISGSGINSGNSSIYLTNTNTGGETFQIAAGIYGVSEAGFSIRNVTDGNWVFNINGSNQVGIGKYDPSYLLHLASDSAAKPSTNTWTVSSDERLKENIIPADLDRCYDIVKQVPLKRYTWKENVYSEEEVKDRSKLGWIANDVQRVFPKAVDVHSQSLKTYSVVLEEYEEQEEILKTETVLVKEIVIVGDHAEEVFIEKEQQVKVPQFYEYDILDKNGEFTGRKYTVPKMIKKTREKIVYDKIEDCLDLNSDQMLAVMYGTIQKLQDKIEKLETIISDNNLA